MQIAALRQKAAEGTATLEDYQKAVILIRGDRKSAVASSDGARRAKAKADIKSADEMLDELGDL